MGVFASWLLLMSLVTAFAGVPVVALQDPGRPDAAMVRLLPSSIPDLPGGVQRELDRRRCRIPQSFANPKPHNVIRGRFTSLSRVDVAVLCSRERVSSILVFRGGSPNSVAEIAREPDATYVQNVGGDEVAYSRALGVASPKYIRQMQAQYGGPRPPRVEHEGIVDSFVDKGSVVWYWSNERWLQLAGSD
jgi:hypothetical protein